jgi:hypothetical protein
VTINSMSDYSDYTDQLQRIRELLIALGDVVTELTPADWASWTEMRQRLPRERPADNSLLRLRHETDELKRMGDALIRILTRHE